MICKLKVCGTCLFHEWVGESEDSGGHERDVYACRNQFGDNYGIVMRARATCDEWIARDASLTPELVAELAQKGAKQCQS
jgi:hypothetical protein